jgi:cobyrinic acid a,c-diamide synthase
MFSQKHQAKELVNFILTHPSVIIAAPASGSGKTTITLGMIRAFCNRGISVSSAKVGPDYIDSKFHEMASKRPCVNLDSWSMRKTLFDELISDSIRGSDIFIIEGVMGLFDGAILPGSFGNGSTASIAEELESPVILVINAKSQAQSVAALAKGFRDYKENLNLAGVILNGVNSERHQDITIFGIVPHLKELELKSRHLGLIQAEEYNNIEEYIELVGEVMADCLDLDLIKKIASSRQLKKPEASLRLKPLGQNIAIAKDNAFSFIYPHIINGWRKNGSEISYFSPLNDETPEINADAIYLPGGYPELYAEKISHNLTFLNSLREAGRENKIIFGECGGYMVLGNSLIDKAGENHQMAGLLQLETTFKNSKLSLGYKKATSLISSPFGPMGTSLRCHEFHYAAVVTSSGNKLFQIKDPSHQDLGFQGLQNKSVFGSFMHLVDYA